MSSYSDYANAVSQLLVGKGASQARATENTGNLWGGAVSSIGPLALQIPQIHAQQTELKQRQQVLDANQRRVTREEAAQAALDNAFSHGTDEDSIVNLLKDTPAASLIPKVREDLQNMQMKSLQLAQAKQAIAQAEQEHMASVARYAMSVPDPRDQAGLLMTGLADSVKSNAITKEQAARAAAGVLNEDGAPDPQRLAQTFRTMLSYAQPVDPMKAAQTAKAIAEAQREQRITAGTSETGITAQQQAMIDATASTAKTTAADKVADNVRADEAAKRQAAAQAEAARHNLAMEKRPVAGAGGAGQPDNVALAVQAMKEGTAPPLLPGRASKEYVAMIAEAKRQNYDLASAATDWMATQKHIATLNGAQQTRLNQAIGQLPELLDSIDDLASQWKAGRFPPLNKAKLALAKNGALGQQAASIARQLDAQIADVTADLGTVYMGGNSPTDTGLELSGKALAADWDEKTLHDMVALARKNVTIRQNSIRNTGVQGASANNPYVPQAAAPTGDRVRVVGPKGETGTIPKGTALPSGWKVAGP